MYQHNTVSNNHINQTYMNTSTKVGNNPITQNLSLQNLENEIWKDIPDYKGLYQISQIGRVKSLKRKTKHHLGGVKTINEKILKLINSGDGYLSVSLCKNGKPKTFRVHQLVSIVFLGHNPDGHKLVVNHIDFNKKNNNISNLEIVSQRENANMKHIKSNSKYTGVQWCKYNKKWKVVIRINGKPKYFKMFKDEDKAGVFAKEIYLKIKRNADTKRNTNSGQ